MLATPHLLHTENQPPYTTVISPRLAFLIITVLLWISKCRKKSFCEGCYAGYGYFIRIWRILFISRQLLWRRCWSVLSLLMRERVFIGSVASPQSPLRRYLLYFIESKKPQFITQNIPPITDAPVCWRDVLRLQSKRRLFDYVKY